MVIKVERWLHRSRNHQLALLLGNVVPHLAEEDCVSDVDAGQLELAGSNLEDCLCAVKLLSRDVLGVPDKPRCKARVKHELQRLCSGRRGDGVGRDDARPALDHGHAHAADQKGEETGRHGAGNRDDEQDGPDFCRAERGDKAKSGCKEGAAENDGVDVVDKRAVEALLENVHRCDADDADNDEGCVDDDECVGCACLSAVVERSVQDRQDELEERNVIEAPRRRDCELAL